jgi:putative hydrolase of the HAD superfamily
VLLDVDGTLVDYVGALRAALAAAAQRMSALMETPIAVQQLWDERTAVAADPAWRGRSQASMRREAFRRLLAAGGVTSDPALEEVVGLYHEARDEAIEVYPDVPDALDALHKLGLTMVAASNGNLDLGVVGIAHYFAHLHFADEVGISKPDPRFFATALERCGVRPQEAVAVGDRLDNDYEPARTAGLHAVLLDRHARFEDTSALRITALTELPDLLEPR